VTRSNAALMIDSADALTAFVASAAHAPSLALDTEFMREKTYRAELCLLQIAIGKDAVCIDPLALAKAGADLSPLAPLFTSPQVVKIMHAARQDLEVLLPATGLVQPVFDTQIAAALAGHPAQVGYAELTRRLVGVELPKAHTRTDWSRRPLSADQQEYALDDVRHLSALRDLLLETLAAKGRTSWLTEELAALTNADALRVDPDEAWRKIKGLPSLDEDRQRLAKSLAAIDRAAGYSTTPWCARWWCACRAPWKPWRHCPRCRNPWSANAAMNCWRWSTRRRSPTRPHRCPGASDRTRRRSRW
jgi:ribonuclease D